MFSIWYRGKITTVNDSLEICPGPIFKIEQFVYHLAKTKTNTK